MKTENESFDMDDWLDQHLNKEIPVDGKIRRIDGLQSNGFVILKGERGLICKPVNEVAKILTKP